MPFLYQVNGHFTLQWQGRQRAHAFYSESLRRPGLNPESRSLVQEALILLRVRRREARCLSRRARVQLRFGFLGRKLVFSNASEA